ERGEIQRHVGEFGAEHVRADRRDRERSLLGGARGDHHTRTRGRELLRHEVADARVAAGHNDRAAGDRGQRPRIPSGCRRHASTSPPDARRSWWWITSATTKVNHFSAKDRKSVV